MKMLKSILNNGIIVSSLRRIKKNYYSNINKKNITDDKKFWKTVTPFLFNKILSNERITLIENDKVIRGSQYNEYFFM